MTTHPNPISVGAPDPELRTSPIMEEMDEDHEVLAQETTEEANTCYFNNVAYPSGDFVCTGSGELLRCEQGMWVQVGTCDPDNL